MDSIPVKRLALVVLFVGAPAWGQTPEPSQPTPPASEEQVVEPPPSEAPVDPAAERMQALEQRMQQLEDELAATKDDNSYLEEKLAALLPLTGKIGGYVDMGAFVTTGNGAGTRTDDAGLYFPQFIGKVPGSWVFWGDPLSTQINSRGDVADTGESRAVVFDPINSRGKSTMLVNAVNLALFSGIGESAQLNASIDFVPRARDISDPAGLFVGDFIDVKLAYAEWRPKIEAFDLMLQAGKFDSVLGFEYRSLESPDRVGVTPSLICRYTCGRPTGLKARAQFLDQALVANVAVTNGSHFSEGFVFASETDTNHVKTVAGRLSYQFAKKVEVGVSGAWGAQDFQPDDGVYQWHWGGDIHVEIEDLEFTGEIVHGRAKGEWTPGEPRCDVAPCLKYTGAYGQTAYRLTNTFVPYVRIDWRDATHWSGASFVYLSQLARATVGVRAEIGTRVIAKIEATKNRELNDDFGIIPVPQIPNDVLTSSLVIKY
jgi:hypothetical protein